MESPTASAESIEENHGLPRENIGRLCGENKKLVTENSELETIVSKQETESEEVEEMLSAKEIENQNLLRTVCQLKEEAKDLVCCIKQLEENLKNNEQKNADLKVQLEQFEKENCKQKEQLKLQEDEIVNLKNNGSKVEGAFFECKKACIEIHEEKLTLQKQLESANEKQAKNLTNLQEELDKEIKEKETMRSLFHSQRNIVAEGVKVFKEKLVECEKYQLDAEEKQGKIQVLESQLSEYKAVAAKRFSEYEKQLQDLMDDVFIRQQTQEKIMAEFLEKERNHHDHRQLRFRNFCKSMSSSFCFQVVDGPGNNKPQETQDNKEPVREGVNILDSASQEPPPGGCAGESIVKLEVPADFPDSLPESLLPVITRDYMEKVEAVQAQGIRDISSGDNAERTVLASDLRCVVCGKRFKKTKSLLNHQTFSKACRKPIAKEDVTVDPELEHESSSPPAVGNKSKQEDVSGPHSNTTASRKKKNAKK